MIEFPSPNYNKRNPEIPLSFIVLHYTDLPDTKSALHRLCDPDAEVSAHYLIGEDGSLWRIVDEQNRAWHAGKSFWRGILDMNSASIGIELANPGHSNGYQKFPDPQINALKSLLREIAGRHNLSLSKALLAHSDIAPTRKKDPGEFFPWKALAREGFGIWPTTIPSDFENTDIKNIEPLLRAIGYDTENLSAVLSAFQRRYLPENVTGELDKETAARICAVNRLFSL